MAGVVVAGAFVLAAVAGCGAADGSAPAVSPSVLDGTPSAEAGGGSTETQEYLGGSVSLVKDYTSFDELWVDTEVSVRGVAGQSRVEVVGKMPFTVTDFLVEASSDPAVAGETIGVRQTGAVDFRVEGLADLLVEGGEYLLMVYAFHMERDGPQLGNQYHITGGQAVWVLADGGGSATPIFPGEADEIRR
ncbi:MAG: hypothetical protein LBS27_01485 [Bifidobacteriaceae bacterium]|jgi:hypothetical protein|nr:hypothetical protein [Bifidobacteriaceae bacterium]